MARPRCCRRVAGEPVYQVFKPAGIPSSMLAELVLSLDEFEAVRLADLEGLYHQQAAERMRVSRATFGRILESARRKIARALVEGLALRMEGIQAQLSTGKFFGCAACGHAWEQPCGGGKPRACPLCDSDKLRSAPFAAKEQRKGPQGFGDDRENP
ncbi:MAG: DUF134 domain-containing protein [Syntrophobacteraceae bacterium]